MAKGQLFEYAVLHHPKATKEQTDAGETPRSVIVVEPKTLLAKDEAQAAMLVARLIPEEFVDKLENVEILLHRF